jgi:hypothetical protein
MRIIALSAMLGLAIVGSAGADGVKVGVGVNIGVPAPPPVIVTPPVVVAPPVIVTPPVVATPPVVVTPFPPVVTTLPPLVVVPGSPVFYAPGVSMNFFAYGGRYYSFHQGGWFVATSHGGPWTAIAVKKVPRPVLAVPVAYYKVPPGHAKKMSHEHGCPPGLAKQGRC